MGDPERIWLQGEREAQAIGEGRCWSEDRTEFEDEPTGYVRADLYDALRAQGEAMREALKEIAGPRDLPHGIDAMIAVRRIAKDILAKSTGGDDGP